MDAGEHIGPQRLREAYERGYADAVTELLDDEDVTS
jgi:hypothetical protein